MTKKVKLTADQKKERAKRYSLMKLYGLTLEEREQMEIQQESKCWICKQVPKSGRLCVDHIHVPKYKKMEPEEKKKYVRALLCFMCNTMLHGLEKRKTARFLLGRMNEYFKEYKIKGDEQ